MSSVVKPVLIEIERPDKRWFRNSDGVQHADLTQAIDQVATWRDWFKSEPHRELFYERYGISDWIRRYYSIEPVYCLIYGRRHQFSSNAALSRKRAAIRPSWLVWMTYDRLRPSYHARHLVTARFLEGEFRVVAVPPTFELGPSIIEGLSGLTGLEEAISRNELIAPERRFFLLHRLPYWQEWVANENHGSYTGGDWE